MGDEGFISSTVFLMITGYAAPGGENKLASAEALAPGARTFRRAERLRRVWTAMRTISRISGGPELKWV